MSKMQERLSLLFLSLAMLLQHLPSFFVPIWTKDEGYWWAVGNSVAQGGSLYQTAADNKPPLFLMFYGWAIDFFGAHAFLALHLFAFIGKLVILYCLYRMAKQAWGPVVAIATALGYFFLQATFVSQELLAANSENLMMPWLIASLFLYWQATKHSSLWKIFLSGILLGIAFHFRQTAAVCMLVFLIHRLVIRQPIQPLLHDLFLFAAGFALVFALFCFHFSQLGTFEDFWFWSYTLSRQYVAEPLGLKQIVWEGFWKTAVIILAGGIVWFLALAALRRWKTVWHNQPLWPLFFFGMCLTILVGWRFSHHYYIQLFPAVTLLAGWALNQRQQQGKTLWPLPAKWAIIAFAIPLLGFTGEAYYRWAKDSHGGPRPKVRSVGAWLQRNVPSDETLFIWGYYPEIYFYSGLKNATRYVETHFLTGQIRDSVQEGGLQPLSQKLWNWFMEDLNNHPPEWIVDTSGLPVSGRYLHPISHYPQFAELLRAEYEHRITIGGILIYRRLPPHAHFANAR